MDIDLNRWDALVEAQRNAEHDGPTPLQLQQAHTAAAQAQADLDRYRAREATGQANRRSSPAEIDANFARGIAELEGRVVERRREADRIAARSKVCADRRNALRQLVDGIAEWARQNSITLPGADDTAMAGFAATSVHVPTPPGRAFEPSQTVPARQGGTAAPEPPAARTNRGGGIVRLMQGLMP